MNQAAIEYRIQRLKWFVSAGLGIILWSLGVIMLAQSGFLSTWLTAVCGVVLMAFSFLFWASMNAVETRGYARAALEFLLRTEFDDPPLNEWREALEEKDAFEVVDR